MNQRWLTYVRSSNLELQNVFACQLAVAVFRLKSLFRLSLTITQLTAITWWLTIGEHRSVWLLHCDTELGTGSVSRSFEFSMWNSITWFFHLEKLTIVITTTETCCKRIFMENAFVDQKCYRTFRSSKLGQLNSENSELTRSVWHWFRTSKSGFRENTRSRILLDSSLVDSVYQFDRKARNSFGNHFRLLHFLVPSKLKRQDVHFWTWARGNFPLQIEALSFEVRQLKTMTLLIQSRAWILERYLENFIFLLNVSVSMNWF